MKNSYFFFLFMIVLFSAGCSKEKQIENNLTNQSGRWNIDNKTITVSTTNLPTTIEEFGDLGYVNFFDNFDGQFIFVYDVGDYDFIEFEWTAVGDNGLIIEYGNEEFEYTLTTNEKDRVVILNSITVPLSDSISTTTDTEYELLRIE